MEKKIIFQGCNFNYIYFLFYIISYIICLFVEFYNYPYIWVLKHPEEINNYYVPSQILALYISNISDFLAIIPFLIRKKFTKNKDLKTNQFNEDEQKSDKVTLIYNNNQLREQIKRKRQLLLYSLLVAVFNFLSEFLVIFYYLIKSEQIYLYTFSCSVPFDSILQFMISYFILKIHFYKHHYFSIIVNIIIFFIIFIIDIINKIKFDSFDGYIFLFYPFQLLFYSLEYAYAKKVFLYGFSSPYYLLIIKGIIKFCFVFIFSLLVYVNILYNIIYHEFIKERK